MRRVVLAVLPLLACTTAADELPTPTPVATVAAPTALVTAGDRAFVATDDGLFVIDGASPTRLAPAPLAVAIAPDGVTLDYADPLAGIVELDTRTLATRSIAGDTGVEAMAATDRDLYWIERYLDGDHATHVELRALDRTRRAVRVVAASLPIDDTFEANRIGLVADAAAAYVRTNTSLVRYDRATGDPRVIASELGVASGLAIEGDNLFLVDYEIATRISIADRTRHVLGRVTGEVEGLVVSGGVATIATSDSKGCGLAGCSDRRAGWLYEADDGGIERVLAHREAARIVGVALTADRVLFAERPWSGGGALLSLPR